MSSDIQKLPKFPCVDCHTDCCKEYTIFVNAHDVYRLSNGLKCKPETFLELIGAKNYSLGIKVEEGLVDLALKQINGACEFLEETDEVFRCTVNDFKPGVCKSYPFEMKNGNLSQMSDIMCPSDWDLTGFKEMMIPHLKKDESEWKFYDQLVNDWNLKYDGEKPLSEFLKFMLEKVKLSLKVQ
ncbi:MAG: YkgJ family cysteine cluster protein [Thaumarchaeota archaeon]|nr:YkgJ family cysteine cluster protein [Nitrososphaerota archaeon]